MNQIQDNTQQNKTAFKVIKKEATLALDGATKRYNQGDIVYLDEIQDEKKINFYKLVGLIEKFEQKNEDAKDEKKEVKKKPNYKKQEKIAKDEKQDDEKQVEKDVVK